MNQTARANPGTDNLNGILRLSIPIPRAMCAMKSCRDVAGRLFYLKLERLAFVSDGQRSLMLLLPIRKAFIKQGRAGLLFHFAEYFFKLSLCVSLCFEHHGAALFLDHVSRQDAVG